MAENEEKPIIKKQIPYQPIKYFVSSLNTFFGHHLVARLRNDSLHPDNPNRIIGTAIKSSTKKVPAGVRKVIEVIKFIVRLKKLVSFKRFCLIRMSSSMI